ncbi:AAA family ATPase [Nocardiopsis alba]|uniref:AAA family ATPase n=1 Tax=Nocardiopsis alba TaxID=53437 RepID=UPI00339FB0E1
MTALERVREALDAHGSSPRGGNQISARCPAHDDHDPSLSVGYQEGKVLLNCHRGCDANDVADALGLRMADLFDEDAERRPECDHARPWRSCDLVDTSDYVDPAGQVLYTQRRYRCRSCGAKTFMPHNPDTDRAGLPKGVRVLYRLPEVLEAAACGETVYVVEGEKDADALASMGHVATTAVNGANARWEHSYTEALKGAHVVVIADNDTPGHEHAHKVSEALTGVAESVRVVRSPLESKGADVSDHLAAGFTLDQLVSAKEASTEEREEGHDQAAEEDPTLARMAELRSLLVDSAGLDDIPDPEPLIDNVLYLDSLAWMQGKPGSGKSFLAIDWAGRVGLGLPWRDNEVTRGTVLYLIAEGVSGVRQRVRAWERRAQSRMDDVRFLPVAVQLMNHGEKEAFVALVAEIRPVLVVIDTQARVTVGADENSSQDMGRLVAAADDIRRASGACVLLVHHEGRSGDNMRGSTAMEGAATTIVRVLKDGPHVRLECKKQKDAAPFSPVLLKLESDGDSAVFVSGSDAGHITPSEEAILSTMRELFGSNGASASALMKASEVAESSFYRALKALVNKGLVVNVGEGRRSHYQLPTPSRDD